jgi:MarR family transcriptional regulator for hemolysin
VRTIRTVSLAWFFTRNRTLDPVQLDQLLFPGFSLSEAGRLYARRFEERSRNVGLDFGQSRALIGLAENEGVTQQRLSELTAIASPWLVRILDRLEVMGLAERRPHLADRRARSLAVTEDARRQVLPLLWNIVGETLREALTGLSTKEIAILAKALHRVIANLSALDRATATDSVKNAKVRWSSATRYVRNNAK